ncbi:MAG: 3-deoxy-manno-octulosonate cytidylyltransferase [Phycisphaerae bacterium]|nr:3-deoxy-manno-octulosonate cytidylyltransferase [Phycisphaerae bacterium]
MKVLAVIPARYASTRFPAKLLANKTGKYLIQHVYQQVCLAKRLDRVLIAADDQRIGDACDSFGANWQMTRTDHQSGTDRIAEVASKIKADIIVNVQGDEPEIDPTHIDLLIELMQNDPDASMATLAAPIDATTNEGKADLVNPNVVKLVMGLDKRALYFSRSCIPFNRDKSETKGLYRRHLGIYAYRYDALLKLSTLPQTILEKTEKLEQLRALENGMKILVGDVDHPAVGIDTPEQYEEFVNRYQNK